MLLNKNQNQMLVKIVIMKIKIPLNFVIHNAIMSNIHFYWGGFYITVSSTFKLKVRIKILP